MSSLSGLLPFALAGLLLSGAASAQAAEKDVAAAGLDLAKKYCARCHAVTETGESPHNQAPPFRTFASKWPLENLEEALAEGIVTGHPDMPAFVFEPDEIDALIEYLYTLAPEQREKN
jgi:cytochrome c